MGIQEWHTVTFLSPGTFTFEETTESCVSWNLVAACVRARDIVERHAARPFALVFKTMLGADPVPDGKGGVLHVQPKCMAKSPTYYLGGTIRSFDTIDKSQAILRDNMRSNGWPFVIEVVNGYKSTHPFEAKDVVLNADGSIRDRGDDPAFERYRVETLQRWEQEQARVVEVLRVT